MNGRRVLAHLSHASLVVVGLALASCSADATRGLPMPGATTNPTCARGTFLGSMTMNCPQPVR